MLCIIVVWSSTDYETSEGSMGHNNNAKIRGGRGGEGGGAWSQAVKRSNCYLFSKFNMASHHLPLSLGSVGEGIFT